MQIPFPSSERASLGVEWELQLVDRETRELSAGAVEILEEIRPEGAEEHPKAKHELLQSTIEIITGICTTVEEAKADLAGTLAEVTAAAEHRGLGLMCAGTHPFTDWQTQLISPKERYLQLVERMQWLARRLQIFGVHVHVGVRVAGEGDPDRQRAVPVPAALPRALGVLTVLGRLRHRAWPRRAPRSSRACRRPGCPTSSPAGTSSRTTWRR